MARINIEDSLFKENAFINLAIKLGSRRAALGALVEAWILAQRHFLTTVNDRLVPFNEWERESIASEIIDVGLAERRENGIYLLGSEDQFGWLIQRSEAGKASASAKKAKKESTTVNDRSTFVNGSQPLSLSLTLSHNSDSTNQNIIYIDQDTEQKLKKESTKFDLESLYNAYPRKEGKKKGIEKLRKIVTSVEIYAKLELAIKNYTLSTSGTEKRFIKQFSSFVSVWEDYLHLDHSIIENTNLHANHAIELARHNPFRNQNIIREVSNEHEE